MTLQYVVPTNAMFYDIEAKHRLTARQMSTRQRLLLQVANEFPRVTIASAKVTCFDECCVRVHQKGNNEPLVFAGTYQDTKRLMLRELRA